MLETAPGASTVSRVNERAGVTHTSWFYVLALIAAISLGVFVRAVPVVLHDFPLNDGGMFYQMVQELQANHYRLPGFTAYNMAGIPYAYSPFGFYATGLLSDITGLSLMTLFRWLPLAGASLTIVAFFLLARSLLSWAMAPAMAVIVAVVAFGLIPRTFVWMISGGGITRAFGFLFALLALHQIHRLYIDRGSAHIFPAALFIALSVLSHIGTARFLAVSLVLFWLFFGRHRHGVISSVVVVLAACAMMAPWLATIMAEHGLAPFLAANQTSGSFYSDQESLRHVLAQLSRFGTAQTSEPMFPLIGVLAFLGALASLTPRRILLPIWWVALIVLDARGAATFTAVPMAMMAGLGITEVLIPALNRAGDMWRKSGRFSDIPPSSFVTDSSHARIGLVTTLILGGFLLYSTVSAMIAPGFGTEGRFLVSLSPEERTAMQWVAKSTPADARFLVYPRDDFGHWADKTAEWFPLLAERHSVTTIQGYEWLPGFHIRIQKYQEAHDCQARTTSCLDAWEKKWDAGFTHIFIPKSEACCTALRASLSEDRRYQTIYDGPGVMVFARRI